jgi:hypothetical protein
MVGHVSSDPESLTAARLYPELLGIVGKYQAVAVLLEHVVMAFGRIWTSLRFCDLPNSEEGHMKK